MNKLATSLTAFASISAIAAGSVPAYAKPKLEIGYYLAKTNVAVLRSGTITSCPTATGESVPAISFKWKVVGEGTADVGNYARIDVSSGFLAKRSTAFTFHPNGTLASFNTTSEGQGAAVLQSLLKAASVVIPMLGVNENGPARGDTTVYCRKVVVQTLAALAGYREAIRQIETKVLQSSATPADLALMERRKEQRDAAIKALTLTEMVDFSAAAQESDWRKPIDPLPVLEKWFTNERPDPTQLGFDFTKLEGMSGYHICVEPAFKVPDMSGTVDAVPNAASRELYFRRPMPANVGVTGLGQACDSAEAIEPDAPLLIGQWGKIESLPVGNAGIFGSRQAAAKFDAVGTPLELSYGSDSGSAGIAGSIDAGAGLATTLHGSEAAALEREIKLLELKKKLADMKAAEVGE